MTCKPGNKVSFQLGEHCTQINHRIFAPARGRSRIQLHIYTTPVYPKPVPYSRVIDCTQFLDSILPSRSALTQNVGITFDLDFELSSLPEHLHRLQSLWQHRQIAADDQLSQIRRP